MISNSWPCQRIQTLVYVHIWKQANQIKQVLNIIIILATIAHIFIALSNL